MSRIISCRAVRSNPVQIYFKSLKYVIDAELNSENCSLGQLYCVLVFTKAALKTRLSISVQVKISNRKLPSYPQNTSLFISHQVLRM